MGLLIALHQVAAIVWIGGMFLMLMAVRPGAIARLEPPLRIALLLEVMARFFRWVWVAVITLMVSGYTMLFGYLGGLSGAHWTLHLMQAVAWAMLLVFVGLYFVPYRNARRLQQGKGVENLPAIAQQLNRVTWLVRTNLTLGLGLVIAFSLGRYL